MEDDRSRSGQVQVDALYVMSSVCVVRLSCGPWAHDEWYYVVKQYGGQFSIMQLDVSWQFRLMQAELCFL